MGLTICNKILNSFESELKVDSAIGRGSNFYFELELPYEIIDAKEKKLW